MTLISKLISASHFQPDIRTSPCGAPSPTSPEAAACDAAASSPAAIQPVGTASLVLRNACLAMSGLLFGSCMASPAPPQQPTPLSQAHGHAADADAASQQALRRADQADGEGRDR
jgi:hypothetical protein